MRPALLLRVVDHTERRSVVNTEVLGRYEQALRDWHTYRMELEKHADGQR